MADPCPRESRGLGMRLVAIDKDAGQTRLIKMAEVTLINLGYCKVESFLAFSVTVHSLES